MQISISRLQLDGKDGLPHEVCETMIHYAGTDTLNRIDRHVKSYPIAPRYEDAGSCEDRR